MHRKRVNSVTRFSKILRDGAGAYLFGSDRFDYAPGIAAALISIDSGLIAENTVFAAPVVDIVRQLLGAIVVGMACAHLPGSH